MEIYLVGGAVRDAWMGLSSADGDRDWVVVGSDPAQMLQAGYLPVGKDFPVFLHPQTREEYALARTERKTGAGYQGFAFHADATVTLEQDLARRDLTINAMAVPERALVQGRLNQDIDQWQQHIIDPYGGRTDIQQKKLRHVSPAFAEDPVRILRLARFAARWPEFSLAPETLVLMQRMVQNGEVKALVAERVWQEIARGLMERAPQRMLQVLQECGALSELLAFPLATSLANFQSEGFEHGVLRCSAQNKLPLAARYACMVYVLVHALPLAERSNLAQHLAQKWRVPQNCAQLAQLLVTERQALYQPTEWNAEDALHTLKRCDAMRRPERFQHLLQAVACSAVAMPQQAPSFTPAWQQALAAAQSIQARDVLALHKGLSGEEMGQHLDAARLQAIEGALAITRGLDF